MEDPFQKLKRGYPVVPIEEKEGKKILPAFIDFSRKESPKDEEVLRFIGALEGGYQLSWEEAKTVALYFLHLDLRVNDILDKKIIDIGSGEGEFKKFLQKTGISGDKIINFNDSGLNADVVGKAEELPFQNESFDLVIAHCSVPIMTATLGDYRMIPKSLQEMLRVVRPGGSVKVFPVALVRRDVEDMQREYLQLGSTVLEELENIHKRYPDVKIKIVETIDQDENANVKWLLEISKPEKEKGAQSKSI
jgi:ubiquinone/menaquinone biosynthesis C-methylase UbiE